MPEETINFAIDGRYNLLLNIHRAAHFEWIRTIKRIYPECDLGKLILAYWDEVARDTADAYLRVLDREKPMAPQLARLIVRSSLAMGESVALTTLGDSRAVVEHSACPWWDWHQKLGFESLDRAGCDEWFEKLVSYINEGIGGKVRVKTESTLPDGDGCCKRIFWEQ